MRILVVADTPPDPDSGVAGTEWQTARALRELGHAVDVLWADDIGPRRIRHGNLHYLLELPVRIRTAVRRALKTATYDIVHVNQPHGFLAAEWLARHHPAIPFVHRSHGLELRAERELARWKAKYGEENRTPLKRAASALLARLLRRHTLRTVRVAAGHIVYVTECRDFLENQLGLGRERIAVIPAAAPDSMLDPPAREMTGERLRTVLYASQFAFFKAPMVVAAAMDRLAAGDPTLRFVWLCDTAHHRSVRELLSPDTRERVELLGWMEQSALRAVYDRAGLFLFPSFFEGFGKVFLEAMARGCVVIASDMAGPHDIIESGRTGFIVAPGDSEAIAVTARSILDDPGRARDISAAAATQSRQFTWRRAAQATAAFYGQLALVQRERR